MSKKITSALLLAFALAVAQGQALGVYRAAYWDGDYADHWIGASDAAAARDALELAGFEILDADQLKTFMNARIKDKVRSVVVFCKDVAPETVCETNTADCTLRKYLDAGGKIVFYGDIPFYNQGNPGGGETNWGDGGAQGILGFNAAGATWDVGDTVTITEAGEEWGLTETWASIRPANASDVDIILAANNNGDAAAWVKHYVAGDIYGGFVRIWDRGNVYSFEDLIRVAEYGMGGNPYPRGPEPADGAFHPDTWVSTSWYAGDFAVSHDVYFNDNFDDVRAGAESAFLGSQSGTNFVAGFPGFPYPDGLVPGTTYYWKVVEVNEAEPNSPWEGPVWSFTIPPKTAYLPEPADGAEAVEVDPQLSWTAGYGGKLHTVYFGESFDEVDSAAGGLPQGTSTYSPGTLKMAKTYYWRVDEFDAIDTYKGDVWSFTTEGAVAAIDPVNGAVDVTQTPVLTWTPGLGATHEVYFGTDPAALELKGSGNLGSESFEPGQLEWNTTYYWRIDEADNTNADSPWTGPLWSFTSANFFIIDDMESYNDIEEDQPGSNRIYVAWADGFDDPTNGSQTGHLDPPFYEETIVHSGNKSMPIYYDNSVGKSEATLTLTDKRDWTVKGVDTLTIWFRGSSSNATEQMYVVLKGTAGVDHDDPEAALSRSWTEWNIDLQAFADQGVNLTNVNSITLGLGNRNNPAAGGSGIMYFDDIRLYAP